jgi:hypothetical protein
MYCFLCIDVGSICHCLWRGFDELLIFCCCFYVRARGSGCLSKLKWAEKNIKERSIFSSGNSIMEKVDREGGRRQ